MPFWWVSDFDIYTHVATRHKRLPVPTEEKVINRGLTNGLWKLVYDSSEPLPDGRPEFGQICERTERLAEERRELLVEGEVIMEAEPVTAEHDRTGTELDNNGDSSPRDEMDLEVRFPEPELVVLAAPIQSPSPQHLRSLTSKRDQQSTEEDTNSDCDSFHTVSGQESKAPSETDIDRPRTTPGLPDQRDSPSDRGKSMVRELRRPLRPLSDQVARTSTSGTAPTPEDGTKYQSFRHDNRSAAQQFRIRALNPPDQQPPITPTQLQILTEEGSSNLPAAEREARRQRYAEVRELCEGSGADFRNWLAS